MVEELSQYSSSRFVVGLLIHLPCSVLRKLFLHLGLLNPTVLLANIRVKTPMWGFDSVSCRRNVVFNDLGLAYFKNKKVGAAINCGVCPRMTFFRNVPNTDLRKLQPTVQAAELGVMKPFHLPICALRSLSVELE